MRNNYIFFLITLLLSCSLSAQLSNEQRAQLLGHYNEILTKAETIGNTTDSVDFIWYAQLLEPYVHIEFFPDFAAITKWGNIYCGAYNLLITHINFNTMCINLCKTITTRRTLHTTSYIIGTVLYNRGLSLILWRDCPLSFYGLSF